MSEPAMRLEELCEIIKNSLPPDVDSLVILAASGASSTILSADEPLANGGPEIMGNLLRCICEQGGISQADALRRLQNGFWTRNPNDGDITKATLIAKLLCGPLDGHVVEILRPDPIISVPFSFSKHDELRFAAYSLSGQPSGGVVSYRYWG